MAHNNPDILNAKQLIAAKALGRGCTILEAAEISKSSDSTIDRWLKLDLFKAQVKIETDIFASEVQSKELELIRQDTHALSKNFESLSGAILALLTESLEYLDPSTIKPSELAKLTDSYHKLAEASIIWREKAWGADRLMESLNLTENEN